MPDILTGSLYAWSDIHSPSSDHKPEDDRYGDVATIVGISLSRGKTLRRSANAAVNQSERI